MSPGDWLWTIFEATGSPDAYLLYRRYIDNPSRFEQVMNETM
ncbi:hypothetical protein [Paradesulfitobacterium ferrireducens]|nr:hypothetical protein [Paradesulfitobacterium ferrireducens]